MDFLSDGLERSNSSQKHTLVGCGKLASGPLASFIMKLPIGTLVLTLTLVKAEEDCSRCASAMTTLFNAGKTQEGYDELSKVIHNAVCEADPTVYSCQDQERAKANKIGKLIEELALSPLEAITACKTMKSKGACKRLVSTKLMNSNLVYTFYSYLNKNVYLFSL